LVKLWNHAVIRVKPPAQQGRAPRVMATDTTAFTGLSRMLKLFASYLPRARSRLAEKQGAD